MNLLSLQFLNCFTIPIENKRKLDYFIELVQLIKQK